MGGGLVDGLVGGSVDGTVDGSVGSVLVGGLVGEVSSFSCSFLSGLLALTRFRSSATGYILVVARVPGAAHILNWDLRPGAGDFKAIL